MSLKRRIVKALRKSLNAAEHTPSDPEYPEQAMRRQGKPANLESKTVEAFDQTVDSHLYKKRRACNTETHTVCATEEGSRFPQTELFC